MALEGKFTEVANNEFYSAAYQRFLSDKRLMGSRCEECGHISVPPKPICPKCQGTKMTLEEMKGKGRLASYTVINVAPPLMVEEGFNRNNPYCSGIVELEEGPKIMARILGVDVTKPEKIRLGMPLSATYIDAEHSGEKTTFLAFKQNSPGDLRIT